MSFTVCRRDFTSNVRQSLGDRFRAVWKVQRLRLLVLPAIWRLARDTLSRRPSSPSNDDNMSKVIGISRPGIERAHALAGQSLPTICPRCPLAVHRCWHHAAGLAIANRTGGAVLAVCCSALIHSLSSPRHEFVVPRPAAEPCSVPRTAALRCGRPIAAAVFRARSCIGCPASPAAFRGRPIAHAAQPWPCARAAMYLSLIHI